MTEARVAIITGSSRGMGWAEPEDIGRVISFLAGEDSRRPSVRVITADGGLSVTGGF